MWKYFEMLLKEKGLKVSDVARGAGIPYSTLSDWKAGRYIPKSDKLQKLANYLDVDINYLLTGETSANFISRKEQQLLDFCRQLNASAQDQLLQMARLLTLAPENLKGAEYYDSKDGVKNA